MLLGLALMTEVEGLTAIKEVAGLMEKDGKGIRSLGCLTTLKHV